VCVISVRVVHMFDCTEPVLRAVLLGMRFAGVMNCLAQVTVGNADCS